MTIIELLVSMAVFGILITMALRALTTENLAYQEGLQRMSAVRNIRYAMSTLESNLRTLGTNTPDQQPELIYAGPNAVAFSADYATNVANDPFAVFYDPGAPAGQVTAPITAVPIPTSPHSFPGRRYEVVPGVNSPAEMIIFFMQPDSATTDQDDFILWRQVNGAPPERVAGGLRRNGAEPFFSYLRLARDNAGATVLREVEDSLIPLFHDAEDHLSPADTARSAVADSVRAVRLSFAATYESEGTREVPLSRLVPLTNAGFGNQNTCGSAPLLGTGVVAVPVVDPVSGDQVVSLNWNAATDELQGEQDVVRYVLWRRVAGSADWGEPYVAIPGGGGPYTYEDQEVVSGEMWQYALAAQDCTPSLSPLTVSNVVVIP
jgi:type II secretory pathway pseudopilin PulG